MAALHGSNGKVSVAGNIVAYIDNWSMNWSVDKDDVTSFGDDAHKFIQGLQTATVSVSGTRDLGTAGAIYQQAIVNQFSSGGTIASVALTLQEKAGTAFSIDTAFIDSVDIAVPVGGKATFGANFTVNEKPAYNGG